MARKWNKVSPFGDRPMTNISAATFAGLATAALMAGCASHSQPQPQPQALPGGATATAPALGGLCHAPAAQQAVGQTSSASVVESARLRSGAQMARVLRPGQAITKEFDPQRLNLDVDANGRILSVRCG